MGSQQKSTIFSCVHCGQNFAITPAPSDLAQLCPYCKQRCSSPSPAEPAPTDAPNVSPLRRWEMSMAGFLSLFVHIVLLFYLALIAYEAESGGGLGEETLQAELSPELHEPPEMELTPADEMPIDVSKIAAEVQTQSPAELAAGNEPVFDPLLLDRGGADGSRGRGRARGGGGWKQRLNALRRSGLDLVIVFDSTGSMGGELQELKKQMRRISGTLFELVPSARISLCAYRDRGEKWVVQGIPLTSELSEMDQFLDGIRASGGGDRPEAVDEGLRWAVENNRFRETAQKVILLFGDAPPHPKYLETCQLAAGDFRRQEQGVVHTITCRNKAVLPEFEEIAQCGGGEAFLTSDEREIIRQLLVLVFGSQYQDQVIETFQLDDAMPSQETPPRTPARKKIRKRG